MMTIGTMPRVLFGFFRPQRRFFSKPAWPHFWGLVTGMAVGVEHSIGRLNDWLREHTHRTNDGVNRRNHGLTGSGLSRSPA